MNYAVGLELLGLLNVLLCLLTTHRFLFQYWLFTVLIIVIGCSHPEITPLGIISTRFLITLHYLEFLIFTVIQYRPSNTNPAKKKKKSRYLFIYFYSQNLILKLTNGYCMLFLQESLISEKMTLVCVEQKLTGFLLLFLHHLVLENVDSSARLWLIIRSHIIFLESAEPCLLVFVFLS